MEETTGDSANSSEKGSETHTHTRKEDMLTALTAPATHTHTTPGEVLKQSIEYLEQRTRPVPVSGTYVKYNTEPFTRMPETTLTINGKVLTFLVDSGATHSVIQEKHLAGVKMSGNFVHSQGASGTVVKESFTVPLMCSNTIDGDTASAKHGFLLSPHCPINLLSKRPYVTLEYQFGVYSQRLTSGTPNSCSFHGPV